MDSLTEAVYRRLTAILCQRDPWENNLQSLEAFVEEKGRLPTRAAAAYGERRLGNWLNGQRCALRAGLLSDHKWQKLRNSSLSLIWRRAQGWLLGDQDGAFHRGCLELNPFVDATGELPRFTSKTPTSQSHRLAVWLSTLRDRGTWTQPGRRAMLESLHPLVAELMVKWDTAPARIDLPAWKSMHQRLVTFVQVNGRLPRSASAGPDKGAYDWLYRNLGRLKRLPKELVKQLHDSHPLIAAKVRAAQQKQLRARLKRSAERAWFSTPGFSIVPQTPEDPSPEKACDGCGSRS